MTHQSCATHNTPLSQGKTGNGLSSELLATQKRNAFKSTVSSWRRILQTNPYLQIGRADEKSDLRAMWSQKSLHWV